MYNLDKESDKGRLVDYLNEILAAENAITERLHKRINETTINELKNLFTQELGERKNHQSTLRDIIFAYGGIPTDSKADVLSLDSNGNEIDITKDNIESDKTIKSVLSKDEGRKGDNDLSISSSESEILRMKEDAMIKNAEMLGYKMVLNIAQKANAKDAIAALRNNLQEKESSYNNMIDLASPLIGNLEDSNNIRDDGKNKAIYDNNNNHYPNKPQNQKSYQLGYEIANILTSAWNTKENPNKVYIFNRRVHHGAIGALLGLSSFYKKQPIVTSMLSGLGAGLAKDDYDDFKEWFLFKKKENGKK